MILVIDNYDSFTYNLVQYLSELDRVITLRNDKTSVEKIRSLAPSHIVISPGPGTPSDAGISGQVIRELSGQIPILGVCLGHQSIGEVFGARIKRASEPCHGKVSVIHHQGKGILKGLPEPFRATRYHSLVIDKGTLPSTLQVTATTEDGTIMALEHADIPLYGVQFHPESILTEAGMDILVNFYSQKVA
jgi:anthranilate synthase/aminodeoxychorismate synthase-like glutamine amidotransferase